MNCNWTGRARGWLRRRFYNSVLLLWALVALGLLAHFAFDLGFDGFSPVFTLCVLLAVLTLILWWELCFRPVDKQTVETVEAQIGGDLNGRSWFLRGVFAGLLISLPPLAVTLLTFTATSPRWRDYLSDRGTEVRVDFPGHRSASSRDGQSRASTDSLYILAVDSSWSVLPKPEGPEGTRKSDWSNARREEIEEVVSILFSHDRGLGHLVKDQDACVGYAFSNQILPLLRCDSDDPFALVDKRRVPTQFAEALRSQIQAPANDGASTDIISVLGGIAGLLERQDDDYRQVTLIVFSDFIHDTAGTDYYDIKRGAQDVARRLLGIKNLNILAISMDSYPTELQIQQKPLTRGAGIDIREFMDELVLNRKWRELPLGPLFELSPLQRKAVVALNLFPEKKLNQKLILKSPVVSENTIESWISFTESTDMESIIFAVRSIDDEPGHAPRLSTRIGGEGESFLIGLGGREPFFELVEGRQRISTHLPITAANRPSLTGMTKAELLIVIPSNSICYVVEMVVMPVIGEAPLLRLLQMMLTFIGLSLIMVTLAVGRSGANRNA